MRMSENYFSFVFVIDYLDDCYDSPEKCIELWLVRVQPDGPDATAERLRQSIDRAKYRWARNCSGEDDAMIEDPDSAELVDFVHDQVTRDGFHFEIQHFYDHIITDWFDLDESDI